MRKNEVGFGAVPLLLVAVVLCVMAGAGYLLWRKDSGTVRTANSESAVKATQPQDYKEGVITIKAGAIADRDEILNKVARPLRDWHVEMKQEVGSIVVDKASDQKSAEDFRYSLSYTQTGVGSNLGFLFGDNHTIDYWLPQLCDDGGCMTYPDSFKAKYPETYAAYQRSMQPKDK